MAQGDVTINASPSSAIIGDTIRFTGHLTVNKNPGSGVGITIYLDTAPAPPTTLASGDTNSNGDYNITWISNYKGSLPIYAVAAAFQGFTSPTIIVAILDEDVIVNLDPPITGALLEFRYRSYGLDEFLYSKTSVNGLTIWPQGTFTVYDLYEVRFPPQTVGGVSYQEARTGEFMYQAAPHSFILVLQEADIQTTITISAPSTVVQGQLFNITGILYETSSLLPIPNQSITISYNGTTLGSAITGIDGDYLIQASIPTEGVYTLTASF